MTDENVCFTLIVRPYADNKHRIVIRAYDDLGWDKAGRVKLTCEVRYAGEVIFPRGILTCALYGTSDGNAAREAVMSLVAMHPGDGSGVDDDYYEDYNEQQLDFVITHGESLDMERDYRYCDENGNVKKTGNYHPR